jgi:hypothetical protein
VYGIPNQQRGLNVLLSFSSQPFVNFLRRKWQARQAHTGGIEDRVADRRRYRCDRMFRGRLGVERPRPLGSATDQSRFTRRQIARRRNLVIAQAERGYAAVFDEHLFANSGHWLGSGLRGHWLGSEDGLCNLKRVPVSLLSAEPASLYSPGSTG